MKLLEKKLKAMEKSKGFDPQSKLYIALKEKVESLGKIIVK